MGDADRTVRTVRTDEELATYLRGMMTAFLEKREVSPEWVAWCRERYDLDRTWAAFDGATQCGTTRTFANTVRLPGGGSVPVSCLTQVTVLPTHTRRGHLTRLMRAQLEHAVEAGEVASLLVAAEWPIYGRFGYGPCTEWIEWEVDVARAEVVGPAVGRCEILDVEAFDAAVADILARQQAVTPGAIGRPPVLRRIASGADPRPSDEPRPARVRVVHLDADGRPDGYAMYDPEERWEGMRPRSTLKVEDMNWVDAVAEREVWRFLLDVDLVATVTAPGSPASVLRSVLRDGRAAKVAGRWDHHWARLLDVPACLGARGYLAAGRVTVEVLDPFLGRGGTFVLDASPEGASCTPADGASSAEVTVPISALGAAWYGGTDLRALAAAGAVDEHAAGAVDRLADLLSWPVPPWGATEF